MMRMSVLVSSAAILMLICCGSVGAEGWYKTKWGMTQEQTEGGPW